MEKRAVKLNEAGIPISDLLQTRLLFVQALHELGLDEGVSGYSIRTMWQYSNESEKQGSLCLVLEKKEENVRTIRVREIAKGTLVSDESGIPRFEPVFYRSGLTIESAQDIIKSLLNITVTN